MKKFVATSLALCMSLTPFTAYAGKNDAKNSKRKAPWPRLSWKIPKLKPNLTRKALTPLSITLEIPLRCQIISPELLLTRSRFCPPICLIFGGSAPYIVGYCGSFKDTITKTVLKDIAPELMESSDTVYAQSDLNIEEIMNLKPDVILYNAGNTAHAEILQASSIPCIGFATVGADTAADPLERYQQWLDLLEDVFGEDGKMDDFKEAGNEIIEDVEDRIADIPEDERPSAMILWKYSDGVPQVSGKGTFGTYWLQHLGVTDVVVDEAQGFTQVDMEQVYSWNPDILFLDGPGLLSLTTEDVLENKVEGADFSTLTAVQNGRVYDTTLGMWNWFTPNPDAPLVFAWLACNTYPEAFADYPLEDTIKEYYKDWYDYEVTDEYLEEMLQY